MAIEPTLALHIRAYFRVCVTTAGQYRHKQIRGLYFAGYGIVNLQGVTRPIHFHNIAGLVMNAHGCLGDSRPSAILVSKLGGHVRSLSALLTFDAILVPEQCHCDTGLSKFFVDILIIRFEEAAARLVLVRKEDAHEHLVADSFLKRPFNTLESCSFHHFFYGVMRASHTRGYLPLTVSRFRCQSQDFSVVYHFGIPPVNL